MKTTSRQVLHIFDAAQQLDRVSSPDAIIGELCACTARYGLTACLITRLPVPQAINWQDNILANGWPAEWYAHYNAHQLYRDDPCALRCRSTAFPFFWHELDRRLLSQPEKMVMDAATDFGLREGICVPFFAPFSLPGVVTFAGEFLDVPPDARLVVHALAAHAFRTALRLTSQTDHPRALSQREGEILQWTAAGKTAWEVSAIFGISPLTVRTHLRNSRQKLGTANTPHAIVEALRRDEIQL